jgi:sugar phosphate isomerase/epimerase
MKISITQLTLTDVTPAELVDIAAKAGADHVCLFPKVPTGNPMSLPQVESVAAARDLRKRIDSAGISVSNVEAVFLNPATRPGDYTETMEIGAVLGAKRLACLNFHSDPGAARDQLTEFCDMAKGFGLDVLVEFTKRSETRSVSEAVSLVKKTGRSNVGLVSDSLHLVRTGGAPADLKAVDPAFLKYAQINDGPRDLPDDQQRNEAVFDRLYPGEGQFPLVEFVRAFPAGTVFGIEAPSARLAKTLSPLERAKRAVEGTRKVFAAAER